MATYHIKEHEIVAHRIVEIRPLILNGQMQGPDQGLSLNLDDGTTRRWGGERADSIINAGSWLIHDDAVKTDYVVSEEVFAVLFLQA